MLMRTKEKLRIIRAVFIYLTALISLNQAAVSYDGYKVYALSPDTSEKIALLKSLDGVTGYDFWQGPRGNMSLLMVAPGHQPDFEKLMSSAEIPTAVAIDDVASKLQEYATDEDTLGNARRGASIGTDWGNFSFDRYLRYDEITEFVENIVDGKSTANLMKIGVTSQGRNIICVKLSTSDDNPVIVIDGGIHAREWAAPMSVLYILMELVNNEKAIKKLTFYIVPLVNPDGYEYSQVEDRFWRKTMSKQPPSNCLGVDANRNFDSHWNEFGADNQPCSSIYSGPNAFSEPESQALRDLIKNVKPVMYLTFHTYGGLILYPWGFTTELPPNGEELDTLGKKAAAEVQRLFNTDYVVGSSTNVLYAASGGSDDWSMEKAGVKLVYCVELEDYGSLFDLPPSKLNKVARQAYTISRVFFQHVEDDYTS